MIHQEDFNENLENIIRETPEKIAVAISGGSDSMALTLLSYNWSKLKKIDIISITVDHNLRKESGKEAKLVSNYMERRGIPHKILKYEGKIPKSNIESIAREYRYKMLFEYCKKENIKYLFIAHNADEQTETFFLNLSRGSGVYGLSSIPNIQEKEGIKIVRPMLNYSKKEIKEYLKKEKQKWIEDPSNKSDKYKRVRVRKLKKVLDELELTNERISKTILNMQRTREAIEFYVNEFIKEVKEYDDSEKILLKAENMKRYPKEIVLRGLSKILKEFGKKIYPPRLENLENIYYKIIRNELNKSTTLFGGKIYQNKENKIVIEKENRNK